jgi:hypothetical protein
MVTESPCPTSEGQDAYGGPFGGPRYSVPTDVELAQR